jgi:hypothetical protein
MLAEARKNMELLGFFSRILWDMMGSSRDYINGFNQRKKWEFMGISVTMGVSDCGKFLVQNGDENPLEMGMEK